MNSKHSKRFSLLGWLFAFLIVFVSLPLALRAADAVASPSGSLSGADLVQWLTPIIVPLVIAGVKKLAPSIPGWALPIIAPLLGVLIDVINSMTTAHQSNLLLSAALGLAGVGVREVKDQIVPAKPAAG